MAQTANLLGIDVGTGGVKAVLIDACGRILGRAVHEYPLSTPRPLWSEQNPRDWHSAALYAIRSVLASAGVEGRQVHALGIAGQMHGLVLLDAVGEVIRPAILWNDQRTARECAEITAQLGPEHILQLTSNPLLTGFTAPKLAWVRRHEPQAWARTAHALLPKDYVRYALAGTFATDVSDASGTALFDVARRSWSAPMCAALAIPHDWLPPVFESNVICAHLSEAAARACGLLSGTPIVAGAGDQAAQALGAGILEPGRICVTIGTSGVVFAPLAAHRREPRGRLHSFCHALPGRWHLMGVMLAAGGSLRWFRDTLAQVEQAQARQSGRDAYDLIADLAAQAPAGCDGLRFLPYLTGERTPHADPHARGVFFGLTLRHGRAALARAVFEGVSFGLRDALELLRELHVPINEIRISGGGARSPFWRQMLADVFNAPITHTGVDEGAALGAALLAGLGSGALRDPQELTAATAPAAPSTLPDGPSVVAYESAYREYRGLYPALAAPFAAAAGQSSAPTGAAS